MNRKNEVAYRWAFYTALAIFVLAGLSGALMRFGALYGFPWQLQFANVRHAHSHLMYFGWVTPALMALIAVQLPQVSGRPLSRRFRLPILLVFIAALSSFLPFMVYGYRPAIIGGRPLPLSVISAGLNILTWYFFIWHYWRETKGISRNIPLQLWDAALVFLIFASLGAWGVALASRLNLQDPLLSLAFTHIFLDTFGYGWFAPALLGLAYSSRPQAAGSVWARRGITALVIGLPLIFLLFMPLHVVPPAMRWLGALGALLAASGYIMHGAVLWPLSAYRWRIPLFFLALTALMLLGNMLPDVAQWATIAGLRVPYLHWLLLGFVTLGLFTTAQEHWDESAVPGWGWMAAAIILLIISLMPLTTLWPAALRGPWTRSFNAWASLAPALAAFVILWTALLRRRMAADGFERNVID